MKTVLTLRFIVALTFLASVNNYTFSQNIGINGNGNNAHASALLDIDAVATPSLGILIPRIALQAINLAAPVTSPATSLLLYNTASASTGTNAVSPGYYYWDGVKWVRFVTGTGASTAWDLLGNAGTTSSTNFIGTTDDIDLSFRRGNSHAGRIWGNTRMNTSFGLNALNPITTSNVNTAFGFNALALSTSGSANVAIGTGSMAKNTTGGDNTAVGMNSLPNNTTGSNNTAVGVASLWQNINGSGNTAFGHNTLIYNTTGLANTALGYQTLLNNITGNDNVGVGAQALGYIVNSTSNPNVAMGTRALQGGDFTTPANNIASNNVAIGYEAMKGTSGIASTGVLDVAVGNFALNSNSTGQLNTAVGNQAMFANTIGSFNTAIGANAMRANTSGEYNCALGDRSFRTNTTGSYNTALGFISMYFNTTGYSNTAIGDSALFSNTTGYNNTALGSGSGTVNTTGTRNTFIGSKSNPSINNLTNATAIGYNAKVGQSNALILGGTGADAVRVGIGTTTPLGELDIIGGGGDGFDLRITHGANFFLGGETIITGAANTYFASTGGIGFLSGSPNLTSGQDATSYKMFLHSGGNLGIGTINPLNKLDVLDNNVTFTGAFDNTNANGTGIFSGGQGGGGFYLPSGSGIAASGFEAGLVTDAASATGTGIRAMGQGGTLYPGLAAGSGGAFSGTTFGCYGNATSVTTNIAGGYFSNGNGDYAYVGYRTAGNVSQKINGTGAVSTIVKNTKNELVNLYCPEAPEVLFQDFGKGTLVNGEAHIALDETFIKNVRISDKHPLRVIIQLEGDCKGVYVTDKTSTGFVVKELQGGNSNVAFTYFVTANRADAYNEDGTLFSKFEDVRYGEAPTKAATKDEAKRKVEKR